MPLIRVTALLLLVVLVACGSDEERLASARMEFEAALAAGDHAAAIAAVDDLEAAFPETPEAALELAVLLGRVGEFNRSMWRIEAAIERDPDRLDLKLALAEVSLLVGDSERALRAVSGVGEGATEYPVALLLRARAQLALGDLDAALATLEQGEAVTPDWAVYRVERIGALVADRQIERALELIVDARGRSDLPEARQAWFEISEASLRGELGEKDAALAIYTARTEAEPTDLESWKRRVALLLELERLSEASEALERAVEARPDAGELYALLASTYSARGDVAASEAVLRRWVAKARDEVAVEGLALYLLQSERAGEAADLVKETLDGLSDAPSVAFEYLYVALLVSASRTDEARREFRAFESRHPRDPRSEYLRARLELAEGDAAAAAERLTRVVPRLDSADVHHWLALALEAQGDYEAAEFRYGLAVSRDSEQLASHVGLMRLLERRGAWEAVAQQAQSLLLRRPDNPLVVSALARAQMARGSYAAAEATLRSNLERAPGSLAPTVALSTALRGQGRFDEALVALDGQATTLADEPEWLAERAVVLGLLGRVDEALASLDRRSDTGEHGAVHRARAFLLLSSGRGSEGLAAAERALALDPGNPMPLRLIGDYHAGRRDFAAAARSYERFLRVRRDDAEVLFRLGVALGRSGDAAGAVDAYRRAAELDPMAVEPRNHLALMLEREGRMQEALAVAQEAYARAESDPAVLDTLGWLYLRADRRERAVALLERSYRTSPQAASTRYHLAIAYSDSGRTAEARTLLNELHDELDSGDELQPKVAEARANLP